MAVPGRIESGKILPDWLRGLFLVAVVLLAYARVYHAGFIWDDDAHLTSNPVVIGPLGLKEIWTTAQAVYYPLVLTTFWVLHKIVGLAPAPYHILNVLVHGLNALVLWRILRELGVRGALFGAALWALHPVMVQSVAWVTELKNTQSCLFYLLSILFFLRWHGGKQKDRSRWSYYILAVLFFALAITSKPSTVMLPAVLVLSLWWRNHRWGQRDVPVLAPFFLISLAASAWTIWEQKFHSGATGAEWAQTFPERLIIAGRAIWFYFWKLVSPHRLIFIYPRWSVDSSRVLSYLPLLAAMVALTIMWLKRAWLRPGFFAAVYFVTSLFPILGLFSVYFFRYSFVSDHFQYLASMGPLALAGAGIVTGLAALKWKPAATAPIGGLVLLVLGVLTWRQAAIYRDVVSLYRDTLEKNPSCWMAHYNLGISLRANGDIEGAISRYCRAIALKPNYTEAHYNLARLLAEKGDFAGAINQYNDALTVDPDDAETHNNLGVTLARAGRIEEAIAHYRKALELRPDYSDALRNFANALLRTGRRSEAITLYEKALQLLPEDADLHADLGSALAQQGLVREAIAHYRDALQIAPENSEAQTKLAWLLSTSSDPGLRNGSEAVRLAEQANQRVNGGDPIVLRVLAASYAETGEFEKAAQAARRARELVGLGTDRELLIALDTEIALYDAGSPYHKPER